MASSYRGDGCNVSVLIGRGCSAALELPVVGRPVSNHRHATHGAALLQARDAGAVGPPSAAPGADARSASPETATTAAAAASASARPARAPDSAAGCQTPAPALTPDIS